MFLFQHCARTEFWSRQAQALSQPELSGWLLNLPRRQFSKKCNRVPTLRDKFGRKHSAKVSSQLFKPYRIDSINRSPWDTLLLELSERLEKRFKDSKLEIVSLVREAGMRSMPRSLQCPEI